MANDVLKKFVNAHWKVLTNEITEVVEALLDGPALQLLNDQYRNVILELLDEHMKSYQDQNIIQNYKIVGDWRNNTPNDILNGKYTIDIRFRHKDSLINTNLKYTTDKPIDDFII